MFNGIARKSRASAHLQYYRTFDFALNSWVEKDLRAKGILLPRGMNAIRAVPSVSACQALRQSRPAVIISAVA